MAVIGEVQQPPQIPWRDRIRLAEAFRLGTELQEQVWKGWSRPPFIVLLVTPEYEFLMRHPDPTEDFELVGFDPLIQSDIYFRERTFPTDSLAALPTIGQVSTIVVGQAENTVALISTPWVLAVLHEHFHLWQNSHQDFRDEADALGLAHGDKTGMWMLDFPFPYDDTEVAGVFSDLCQSLANVLRGRQRPDFMSKLAVYLESRKRFKSVLSSDDYNYFSFQVWMEGVAHYAEHRIAELAEEKFVPSKDFSSLRDFTPFREAADSLNRRISSGLTNTRLARARRVAFYSVGAAEAMLLDEVNPGWQEGYMKDKFFMERYFLK